MKKLHLQGVILIITAMLSAVLLSACGKNPDDKKALKEQEFLNTQISEGDQQ